MTGGKKNWPPDMPMMVGSVGILCIL